MCQTRKGIELTDLLGGSGTSESLTWTSGMATEAIWGKDSILLERPCYCVSGVMFMTKPPIFAKKVWTLLHFEPSLSALFWSTLSINATEENSPIAFNNINSGANTVESIMTTFFLIPLPSISILTPGLECWDAGPTRIGPYDIEFSTSVRRRDGRSVQFALKCVMPWD